MKNALKDTEVDERFDLAVDKEEIDSDDGVELVDLDDTADVEENSDLDEVHGKVKAKNIPSTKDIVLMSADEEVAFATEFRDQGTSTKRKDEILVRFIQANMGLVYKESQYFHNRCAYKDIDELISVGKVGLIKAVGLFDPARGCRFSTMAVHWVRQVILLHIKKTSVPVHVPSNIISLNAKRTRKGLDSESLSDKDVAEQMGITEKTVMNMRFARVSSVHLDAPCDYDSGGKSTFADVIQDENSAMPYDSIENEERIDFMKEALSRLSERDRDIIMSQVMGDEKTNLSELGRKYGLSGERIRQIREKGLKKIRMFIERESNKNKM